MITLQTAATPGFFLTAIPHYVRAKRRMRGAPRHQQVVSVLSDSAVAPEYRALVRVGEPGLDVVGVPKSELAGNLPDLSLLVARDRFVGRRDREQTIEQFFALGVGRDLTELAGHQEVLRSPEEPMLALGDLNDEDRLRRRQVSHPL